MEIVGVLKNARRVDVGEDPRAPCLAGHVYGDTKGRFYDGERITTSTIMSEEGDVFRTRFSAYRVESWAPDKDGWIEWGGGECPVGADDLVVTKYRSGEIQPADDADSWSWLHDFGKYDIVAYRVVAEAPAVPKPANDNTFTNLREANSARQDAWIADSGNVPDLSFRGNELAGEVGEACNVIKKLERARHGWRGSRDTVEHLAEELADVVICADLIAISAGIDLDAAVALKFNATSEKQGFPHRMYVAEVGAA